jgi:hypothetical protein
LNGGRERRMIQRYSGPGRVGRVQGLHAFLISLREKCKRRSVRSYVAGY